MGKYTGHGCSTLFAACIVRRAYAIFESKQNYILFGALLTNPKAEPLYRVFIFLLVKLVETEHG